jgi:hypothetical protein
LGISKKPFHKYLTMTLKKYFKDAKEIEPPAVWKTKFKVLALPSVLLIIVIGALSFLGIQLHGKSKAPIGRQISNISYKKISFERYITAGNFKSGDRSDQTGKLVVFYVKGTADVEFDLKNLELSREPQGVMAVYRNTKASQIGFLETKPFIIDVNIAQKDIFQVFHIDPQALRESQARFPAAAFGTVAALGGAYVGGQLGTAVGSAMPHPIFKLAAGPGGAILGGTAGGMGGYILAKNLLTKVQITDAISQGDKEEILSKTKALIAAELLFDEKLSEEMKKEFEAYVKNFYRQFAIEISDIKYSIQTTTQKS